MVNDLFVSANEKVTGQAGNSQNMALLEAATNINPSPTLSGGEDQIVNGGALLASVGPNGTLADVSDSTPTSDQISNYTVHKGDTIAAVAKMFNVSSNTILWANDLKRGTALKEGQVLVILPISGIQHTVIKGETLASIVKKYGGDKEEIMSYNGLESERLTVGDVLIIPDGEISTPATTAAAKKPVIYNDGGPVVSGYYAWPVAGGRVTQGLHGHNGIDVGAPKGTPIKASAGGTVLIARDYGWNGGYGEYIVIKHDNGTQTLYGHASEVNVRAGQIVSKGQIIGAIGNTGKSTGYHLHFEVRGAANPFR